EPADLGIAQVLLGRLPWTVEQLLAIDDLQDATFVGAVREINPIPFRSCRNRAVQSRRDRSACARLLPGKREFANLDGPSRIAEVVNLSHPVDAPTRNAGHKVGDARIALPPVLVRALDPIEPGNELRRRGIDGIP